MGRSVWQLWGRLAAMGRIVFEHCTDHQMQAQNPSICWLGRWHGTQTVKANPIREDGMQRVYSVWGSANTPKGNKKQKRMHLEKWTLVENKSKNLLKLQVNGLLVFSKNKQTKTNSPPKKTMKCPFRPPHLNLNLNPSQKDQTHPSLILSETFLFSVVFLWEQKTRKHKKLAFQQTKNNKISPKCWQAHSGQFLLFCFFLSFEFSVSSLFWTLCRWKQKPKHFLNVKPNFYGALMFFWWLCFSAFWKPIFAHAFKNISRELPDHNKRNQNTQNNFNTKLKPL